MLTPADLIRVAAYVVLSLGAAFAGSIAAVCLVPMVQSGQVLRLGGHVVEVSSSIGVQAAVFAAASASFALTRWLTARLGAQLVSQCAMRLRNAVHARLIHAPLASIADATSAEIANVLTHNVEIITQGFSAGLQLLVACVTSMVSLGFALLVSPILMLSLPLLMLLGVLASRVHGREQSQVSRQYVADLTRLFWLSEDFPRRLRHVRSFGREAMEKASYGAISARLGQGYRRQLELVASGRLMLEMLGAIGIAAVFVLAHYWHGIERASLIAVSLLLGRLLPYLVSTRQSFQQLHSAIPAFELWQRYADLDTVSAFAASPSSAALCGVLRIERMRFTPPSVGLEVNELILAPGEMTLICGDSGIGKSSLVDVLAGMATPQLFVAQRDGQSVDFDTYRGLVRHGAYVSQHVRPWHYSVRECLLWADPSAGETMMWSALTDVGLASRLRASSHGLDTALHDASSRLSGGELQRLLLAQVILRKPFLALLDETTGALDMASEQTVLATMKQRLSQTVLIVVSHRSNVAAIADQCLTLGGNTAVTVVRKAGSRRIRDLPHLVDSAAEAP